MRCADPRASMSDHGRRAPGGGGGSPARRTLRRMTSPANTTAPAAAPAPVDPQAKILEHLASIRTGVNTIATVLVLGVIAGIALAASNLF